MEKGNAMEMHINNKIIYKNLESIDFEKLDDIYNNAVNNGKIEDEIIERISYKEKKSLKDKEYNLYYNLGKEIIEQGKYAVVTMAGGQGTRLGYTAPKGTFEIGKGINKSLFEALSDTIKDAQKKYNTNIPWYIMTSNENNNATKEFFEIKNYFGLTKENVLFFIQGELPMVDFDGKIIVDENNFIKMGADGNGGVFESLLKSGYIDDMKKRGIEWIFISGVDNVLAGLVDPIAIGLAISEKNLAVAKSVVKRNPYEKVGVFIRKNGKPAVIEYSEISEKMANERDINGDLVYSESYVVMSAFNILALEKIAKEKLPFHKATKKVKFKNEKGEIVNPIVANVYKYETFLFDAFELLDDISILRVSREDEFAPIKNAEGEDSPDTAIELYINKMNNN